MGCGESKHAVATENTITQSKPLNDDGSAAPETANGIQNAPNGEKKDDSNATQAPEENNDNVKEIVGDNGELPSEVENVENDGKKNEGAVVAEGEELRENNVDNQETSAEKTSSNGDVAAEKNGSTEETKDEDLTNQNNEEIPKEENIPHAEEIVVEHSKDDSKAN